MGEHPVEAWVQELKGLWHDWVDGCSVCGALKPGDYDSLTLFTYHLLLPEPELAEIRHALYYMLVEVLGLSAGDVPHPRLEAFARQLHQWRATKPRISLR